MNDEMVNAPIKQERQAWVRPLVKRLDAGSAENFTGPNQDTAVNIS
jgi:hypothetical protein